MEIFTNSVKQTKKLGEFLAKEILSASPLEERAFVLAMKGDLGSGKTTFLQGFAKGLGIKEKITSPTFVIMKKFKTFYHFDCYRAERAKDILDLGFKEIINNPKNIVAIEWADKIKRILPKSSVWINFKFVDKNKRKIMIE